MKHGPRFTGVPPHDRCHGHKCGGAPLRPPVPLGSVENALRDGILTLAVSTPVLLEYEEVVCRYAGSERWKDVARSLELLTLLHDTVRLISPTYRFHTINGDPDDDAFADCAIAAEADFLITSDRHFTPLTGSGYKPQPITPEEFIRRFPGMRGWHK